MFVAYLSPLAPAATLLLGAFILSIVFPWLPKPWQSTRYTQWIKAPVVVGVSALLLTVTRVSTTPDESGRALQILSGWNFSTVDSVAALTIRADLVSLVFLFVAHLLLLAVTLAAASFPLSQSTESSLVAGDGTAGWLMLGAAAMLLFVAANGLTVGYAIFLFDLLTGLYWLKRGQTGLGVARLFLGVLVSSSLVLTGVSPTVGLGLFYLALWLRLGIFPVLEGLNETSQGIGYLVYLVLSFITGIYLFIRILNTPPSLFFFWLILITMLVGGWLGWLANRRTAMLTQLVAVLGLLLLLVNPSAREIALACTVGFSLSLAALWIMPALGSPYVRESAWLWPYLPAAGATLTLAGMPYFLSWPLFPLIYGQLVETGGYTAVLAAALALGLGLSGLVGYWREVWLGREANKISAAGAVVAMVPFLLPGLGLFIMTGITGNNPSLFASNLPASSYWFGVLALAAAGALGYFKLPILQYFNLPADTYTIVAANHYQLYSVMARWADRSGKQVLRVEVFLQGQHYLGWAILTALVGALIFILGV
jgi:hypothetical protein